MKRFILFLVVAVMLVMLPIFAEAMAPGQSGTWTPFPLLDIGGEVIIFEYQGIDIQVASAESCGSCHYSIGKNDLYQSPGGHPAPAFVSIGKRVIQRRMFQKLSHANLPGFPSGPWVANDIGG